MTQIQKILLAVVTVDGAHPQDVQMLAGKLLHESALRETLQACVVTCYHTVQHGVPVPA